MPVDFNEVGIILEKLKILILLDKKTGDTKKIDADPKIPKSERNQY